MVTSNTKPSRAAHLTATMACGVLIAFGVMVKEAASAEDPPASLPEIADADSSALRAEIENLSAPSYAARMAAMQRLIEAGPSAVDLIVDELGRTDDAELQLRALEVLERLARREIAMSDSRAVQALESLRASDKQVLAGRAGSRLKRVAELRRRYARERLTELGAEIDSDTWRLQQLAGRPAITHSVVLDSQSWQGTSLDARLLTELGDVGDLKVAGTQITDDYVEPISQLEGLVSLSIKRTRITDIGIARLVKCQHLAVLQVRYAEITDNAVESLSQMNLHSIEITGTRMTSAGVETLSAAMPGAKIDFKAGAYLGVGADQYADGEKGCRLTRVEDGSAAEKAGLVLDDIIITYDGKEVRGFESLRDLIAQNRPGEFVAIEWLRRGKQFKSEVELGEWE